MYESPINILKSVEDAIRKENEIIENEVYSSILKVGVNVNKEELIKALRYDRGQYNKGYKDGFKKGIIKFAEMVKAKLHFLPITAMQERYITESEIDNLVKEMESEK